MTVRILFMAFFSLLASSVSAQQWERVDGGMSYIAQIEQNQSSLRIGCSADIELGQNYLEMSLGDHPVEGQTQFQFDDGSQQAVLLDGGQLRADTSNNASLFTGVTSRLKSASKVTIRLLDGAEHTFVLRGSSRAIGECPLPTVPFDIANCKLERAFGYVKYRNGTFVLSDFCIDRDAGGFQGAENVSGLTLVKDDGVNFTYEDLANGRGSLQIAPVLVSTYHGGQFDDQSPEFNYYGPEGSIVGFVYNELATPESLAQTFQVYLSTGYFGLIGEGEFVDGEATFSLIDNVAFGMSRNGAGELTFRVADDGSVTATGSLSADNIRIAGYGPNEWVSARFEVTDLRGFATGAGGQVIKAYAELTGEMTDAEGDVDTVLTRAEVFLYAWQ